MFIIRSVTLFPTQYWSRLYALHKWTTPVYGQRLQMTTEIDLSPPLGKKETNFIQSVVGTLPYYARYLDPTMLRSINEIS